MVSSSENVVGWCKALCSRPIAGPLPAGVLPTPVIIGFKGPASCSVSDLDGADNDITAPLIKASQKIARTLHGNAQGNGKYG